MSPPSSPPPGERLIDGRYAILAELGTGGMGSVYQVRDQVTGRVLALKILAADGERQRERLMRFRREFRAASRLVHPNIVRGEEFVSGRLSYFTMEYFPGRPVSACFGVGERRLSPPELNAPERIRRLFSVLHQISLALGYVHAQRIVHRDLKPENVLVADAPAAGELAPLVKLMDFGLARDLNETVVLTQPGTVLGTLSYISPELASGRAIDGRSDLYALGVLLYVLLTGTVPFGTDTVANVLWKHCSQAPEPPRRRNPGINRFLESLCLRLLMKDPFERPQTAEEVLRLIEKAGRGGYPLPDVVCAYVARAEPRHGQMFAPRLVGRDGELARLTASVDAAVEGSGALLALVGAPGSGRRRLLAEAAERARAGGATVLVGCGDPADPRPLAAFRPVLEELARRVGALPDAEAGPLAGPEPERLAALDRVLADVRVIGRASARAAAAPCPFPAQVEALAGLLRRLGQRGPIVIVLEELEAFDELSLGLARRLAGDALGAVRREPFPAEPGLVVWTAVATDGPALAPPGAGMEQLELPPLGLGHGAMLLHSMLGQELEDLGLAEAIWAASAGQPGVIEELGRLAVAEGALGAESGRWLARAERVAAFRARLGTASAAAVLAGAVASQMESAGPAGEAVLAALVSLPRDTGFEVLAAAAGLAEGAAIDAAEALLRARVVDEGRATGRLQISSGRVEAAVRGRVGAVALAAIHGRALAALERGLGGRRAPDPVLLAHHAWESGEASAIRRLLPAAIESLETRGATATAARWRERLRSRAG